MPPSDFGRHWRICTPHRRAFDRRSAIEQIREPEFARQEAVATLLSEQIERQSQVARYVSPTAAGADSFDNNGLRR